MASQTTTDHEKIRSWAQQRNASPARVKATGDGDDPGILRLDFPGYSGGDALEPISWEEWFQKFDGSDLALPYQEETAEGQLSHFNKLMRRD